MTLREALAVLERAIDDKPSMVLDIAAWRRSKSEALAVIREATVGQEDKRLRDHRAAVHNAFNDAVISFERDGVIPEDLVRALRGAITAIYELRTPRYEVRT